MKRGKTTRVCCRDEHVAYALGPGRVAPCPVPCGHAWSPVLVSDGIGLQDLGPRPQPHSQPRF